MSTDAAAGLEVPASGASPRRWAAIEGSPFPQGVCWVSEDRAYNFALYSKHARSVALLLFGEEDPGRPLLRLDLDPLKNRTGRIWHCRVSESDAKSARYYGYAVGGPQPTAWNEWHAFDPDKVLLDPYARAVRFPEDFDRCSAMRPGSNMGRGPLGAQLELWMGGGRRSAG